MATAEQQSIEHRSRGRPRVKEQPRGQLVRKNLLVDPGAIEELRRYYGAASDSEAVRWAVESAVTVAQAQALREKVAASGYQDADERTSGASRLPVHLEPADVPDDEKIDYPPG